MFVLNSDITIGNLRFDAVHEVRIKRSIHSYVDTASIKLPSKAVLYTKTNSANPKHIITGTQFNDGDPVTISLGYNGDMHEEFRGFVKRRNLDMPLEIECEGYSYQMRHNEVNGVWTNSTVKELAAVAIANTDIKILVADDIALGKIKETNGTGAQLIDFIQKATDNAVIAFFIDPQTLWLGMPYTAYAQNSDTFGLPEISMKLGFNCYKDNELKERVLNDNPLVVIYDKKTATGQKLSETSKQIKDAIKKHHKLLNHILQAPDLKKLAQEKQYRLNYAGYEGKITAFLQPFALPGYKINIYDDRYPERNGKYLIESTEVIYGTGGARRMIEVGPKIGFGNE